MALVDRLVTPRTVSAPTTLGNRMRRFVCLVLGHRGNLYWQDGLQRWWNCPYCGEVRRLDDARYRLDEGLPVPDPD